MDHRCPHCGKDLSARKLAQMIIARPEIDCSHCKRRVRVNVHRAEAAIIVGSFAGLALCAALAYWLQRDGLYLVGFAFAMAGAAAQPLLERTWLRSWPRYVPLDRPGPNS